MAWARQNRYIVFTNDLDYGALLFATAAASPSVIQIRAEDIRPASAEHAVLFALEAAAEIYRRELLSQLIPAGCGFLRYHSGDVPLKLRKACLAMT
jgi:predicted nuclease of predicted toxin-antitoxin system